MPSLAIINRSSNCIVAWKRMRIAPGGKVRLSDYYASLADAKHDFDLMRFVTVGKLEICEVDSYEDTEDLAAKIARLEAQADAERDAGNAKRKAERLQAKELRKDRQLARQADRYKERKDREAQAEKKVELDLSALFEQSRKQRLVKATEEQRRKIEEPEKDNPHVGSTLESLLEETEEATSVAELTGEKLEASEMNTESAPEEPKEKAFTLPEADNEGPSQEELDAAGAVFNARKKVREDRLRALGFEDPPLPVVPIPVLLDGAPELEYTLEDDEATWGGPDGVLKEATVAQQVHPETLHELPDADDVQSNEESITTGQVVELDTLTDEQLRCILNEFQVKGRQSIKKRTSLLSAVGKLGLNDKDLAQSLSGMEQNDEQADTAQG